MSSKDDNQFSLVKRFFGLFSDFWVATGASIVAFSIGLVILILVTAVPVGNPYLGLFTFVILPTLVIVGGIVFSLGVFLARRDTTGIPRVLGWRPWLRRYLEPNFHDPRYRRRFFFFLGAGVIEVIALSIGGLKTAEFMDTPEFCGQVCHTVMKPEYTVYEKSPHAKVPCVDCHIGPGASWLVKSKISGIRQVFAVLGNTYDRPIQTPVANLRPARDTCERCHWPEKFSGDLVRTYQRFEADEKNTKKTFAFAFNVGGGEAEIAQGIHWHIGAKVWYLAIDEKRQQIAWVGVEGKDGQLTEYVNPGLASQITPQKISKDKRLMDCVDCHNRATHIFRSPEELIDQGLSQGKIDTSLPYVKKLGIEALSHSNPTLQEVINKVGSIEQFYQDSLPSTYTQKKATIDKSIAALKDIARLTTFPSMDVSWETHPNNLGHTKSPGCFRCHGQLVATTDQAQRPIDASCNLCHETITLPNK
ncbi:MAG: NapC/NirT family cytochrome c [Chloroflexi bacterium]|nr:NapC/NirT family cytochrome c [Chloroflexota bacterium]